MGTGPSLVVAKVIRARVTVVTVFILVETDSRLSVAGIRRTEIPIVTRFRGEVTRPVQRITEVVRTSNPIETFLDFELADTVFTGKVAGIRGAKIGIVAARIVLTNFAFTSWDCRIWLVEAAHERIAEVRGARVIISAIKLIVNTSEDSIAAVCSAVIGIIADDINIDAVTGSTITGVCGACGPV